MAKFAATSAAEVIMTMLSDFGLRQGDPAPLRGYFRPSGDGHMDQDGAAADPQAELKIGQFRALVENPAFPCVGAKSAFARKTYRVGLHQRMGSRRGTPQLASHLYRFIQEQDPETGILAPPFTTYVAIFDMPHIKSESNAHELTWRQLQELHSFDVLSHAYAPDVSSDPAAPDFAFSVGGKAFFIVGLNPCASRLARRFAYPTLVLNAHSQFKELRRRDAFERIQDAIRGRDHKLQGVINPNLSSFGDKSEAMQYSGLRVTDVGRCPFHPIPAED
jgi:FPC/CPF motif-containing protein YcgG